jgi:hypothetical protein
MTDSGGIYIIENIGNGMKYIGMANSLATRRYQHFYYLKRNEHKNSRMQDDYNEWGPDYFNFRILVRSDNKKVRRLAEKALIKFADHGKLYNIAHHHRRDVLYQVDPQAAGIATYSSFGEAERATGVPKWAIQGCTRAGGGITGGYYWTVDGRWLRGQKGIDPFGLNGLTHCMGGSWHKIKEPYWCAYRKKISRNSNIGYIRISQLDGITLVYSDVRPSKKQTIESLSSLPFSIVFSKIGRITKTGIFAE